MSNLTCEFCESPLTDIDAADEFGVHQWYCQVSGDGGCVTPNPYTEAVEFEDFMEKHNTQKEGA